jgi:hypothetical protein
MARRHHRRSLDLTKAMVVAMMMIMLVVRIAPLRAMHIYMNADVDVSVHQDDLMETRMPASLDWA